MVRVSPVLAEVCAWFEGLVPVENERRRQLECLTLVWLRSHSEAGESHFEEVRPILF